MSHREHRGHREEGMEGAGREPFDPSRMRGPRGDDVFDPLTHAVIGAAIEVHRTLGPGFLEAVYEEALAIEFDLRGIMFERQLRFIVPYKGRRAGEGIVDFLVDRRLVVELKSVKSLAAIDTAQAISYLSALKVKTALLINFNEVMLKDGIRRISI